VNPIVARKQYSPPDYVANYARTTYTTDAAKFLQQKINYEHCPTYEINCNDINSFYVQISQKSTETELIPHAVQVTISDETKTFLIYDTRKHPPSIYYYEPHNKIPLKYQDRFKCPVCEKTLFHVAVSFEIPDDAETVNDVTWFYLALECQNCKWKDIAYEDETG
jgi:hypothetical protein